MAAKDDCIFCKIVAGEIPCFKVYEDDRALAFMDISPLSKGHLLVVPKKHCANILEMDPDLYGYLCSLVAKLARAVNAALAPDGMNVQQLNGKAANQVVMHVHVHLVPRWHGDGITISEWELVPGNMDEISAIAEQIKGKLGG